jgi:hypothetical protein
VAKQKQVAIILGSILILGLVVIPSCSAFNTPNCIAWEFSANGDSEGWQVGQGITVEVQEGYMVGKVTQPPGFWVGSDTLNIEAAVYKSLEIRYRIDSLETSEIAYFYWAKAGDAQFGNNKRVKFDVQADNAWHDAKIDLAQNVNWNGIITGIYLYPVWFSSAGTSVEYDYIRLCQ